MDSNGFLDGRVVVITGGAGGFGRLLAAGAARRGAKVVVTDIAQTGVDEIVDQIRGDGGAVLGIVADVTRLADMKEMVAAAVAEFGAVDVMINNAGTMPLAFIADHEQAADAWDRCIDINIKGVLHGMIATHDQMIAQGRGHIVNISSIYGNFPVVGAAVYGATKAAVNTLSESYRVESQGAIKVTTVRPTGVPATGLASSVVNPAAAVGILGQNFEAYLPAMLGQLTPEQADRNSPAFAVLPPDDIAEQVLYAIDQPWGVSIGDITVRATGDRYVL